MLIATHSPAQIEGCIRTAKAMQLNAVDGRLIDAKEAANHVPLANQSPDTR